MTEPKANDPLRQGETAIPLPDRADAHLVFIGRIRTPFQTRLECPRQGKHDGPICRVEVDAPWHAALCRAIVEADGTDFYKKVARYAEEFFSLEVQSFDIA